MCGYLKLVSALLETKDIVVLTPLAGREHPAVRNIIGNFINLVPIRVHNIDSFDNHSLTLKVRELVKDAARNQDSQFDRVIDELELPFPCDRNPLSGVSLNYLPQGVAGPVSKGSHNHRGHKLKYDMLLLVQDYTNSMNIEIRYRSGIFNQAEIEVIFNDFEEHLNKTIL